MQSQDASLPGRACLCKHTDKGIRGAKAVKEKPISEYSQPMNGLRVTSLTIDYLAISLYCSPPRMCQNQKPGMHC